MVHPTPNGLVGNRNTAFRQQVLDVAEAEREPEIEQYRLVDDLPRRLVSAVADFAHCPGYRTVRATARQETT